MEVVLDQQQKPQGVFLPLDDWEQLKHVINRASDLYKLMDDLTHPDIFEMDAHAFAGYVAPIAQDAVHKAFDQGLYFSYPSGNEDLPSTFIHEYKNGKKVLVKIDTQTGKEHFLKNL